MSRLERSCAAAIPLGLYVALSSGMLLFSMEAYAQAQPALTRHVRQEVISGQAQYLSPLPATQSLRLDIVMPLSNKAGLDKFLRELADPSSPSYGHFLTVSEFTARFGPSEEDYDALTHYILSNSLRWSAVLAMAWIFRSRA
jgi:subtilase family serine protease